MNITYCKVSSLPLSQVMRKEELPTLDTWLNCGTQLCQVVVQYEGLIEDAGCSTVEVYITVYQTVECLHLSLLFYNFSPA